VRAAVAQAVAERGTLELAARVAALGPVELDAARAAEHAKYARAYQLGDYRMGGLRLTDAVRNLADLPCRGGYLDVGCGRGEMLRHAELLGFSPARGTEVVPDLVDGERVAWAEGHALPFPDAAFDVVTSFDVLEHVLPGDDERVVRELRRVARRHLLVTANNLSSLLPDGTELHVNRRPYADWERLLGAWLAPAVVRAAACQIEYEVSPMWRVDL
jgi:SAM-dependent methyltransferase